MLGAFETGRPRVLGVSIPMIELRAWQAKDECSARRANASTWMSHAPGRAGCLVGAVVSLFACGNNPPELPPGLEDAIRDSGGTSTGAYPEGPYGVTEGSVARNLCFDEVWSDPVGQGFAPEAMRRVCFAHFYNPGGDGGARLLLVNTAAVWCAPCATEWGGGGSRKSLSEEARVREERGLRVLGLLFENVDGAPATVGSARTWAEAHAIRVPYGIDPDFLMGVFADRFVQPFNMLLDTESMTIVLAVEGDQHGVLFDRIDRELGP